MSTMENNGKTLLDTILEEWEIQPSYLSMEGFDYNSVSVLFEEFKKSNKVKFEDGCLVFRFKKPIILKDEDDKVVLNVTDTYLDPSLADADRLSKWKNDYRNINTKPELQYKAVYDLIRMFDAKLKDDPFILAATIGKQVSNGDMDNILFLGAISFLY